jgi:hypothetical protein
MPLLKQRATLCCALALTSSRAELPTAAPNDNHFRTR